MSPSSAQPATIRVDEKRQVSALLTLPSRPRAAYVFAHGAGAGMKHPFMESTASALAAREIATLRFQFPYMESGSRRPDPPAICHLTVRAAVQEAARRWPTLPLIAGGRSFGGRMTSQAQADSPLPGVRGLAFFGFPLHPAGRPSEQRADHLREVAVPMLFLQGTRDELAELSLLQGMINRLNSCATLTLMQDANHSFHVPARSGRNDAQLMEELAKAFCDWLPTAISA